MTQNIYDIYKGILLVILFQFQIREIKLFIPVFTINFYILFFVSTAWFPGHIIKTFFERSQIQTYKILYFVLKVKRFFSSVFYKEVLNCIRISFTS